MKRFFTLIVCFLSLTTFAQDTIPVHEAAFGTKKRTKNMNTVYHRSSLHNILIFHDDQKYSDEILDTYKNRPQSEKFNDHTLASDIIKVKGAKYLKSKKINKYVNNNDIANALVAKWFNLLWYDNGASGCGSPDNGSAGCSDESCPRRF